MESKRSQILQWVAQGVIDKQNAQAALTCVGVLPTAQYWKIFIEQLLLWLGGLALAFSVMFFIAYNWSVMGRFAKFALIESALVVCVLLYLKFDVEKIAAKVALTMATILLGVLLAFYGQTYQTGADPWQLFANWALLMLPWALVAQFAAIWLLWIGLLNLAITLYFQARGGFFWRVVSSTEDMFWILFLFNSLMWLLWELLAQRFSWLAERWAVRLLAIASGASITFLCLYAIFENYSSEAFAVVLYFAWAAVMYLVYRKRIPDLFMLAGLCLSGIVVANSFFARHLLESGDTAGGFFFLTFLVIGMAAGAAVWLKNIYQEQQL